MSFEIKKIYTDNPYVDEMVYYTKLMGADTVLKLQNLADSYETAESIKKADLYIACVEGTAIFEILPYLTVNSLKSAGIILPATVKKCLEDKYNVPKDKRPAVLKAFMEEYIENYEDLNLYYRALHGLPPVGKEDYVEDWMPPNNVSIDLSKPIHLMNQSEINILERYNVLEDLMAEDPKNRQYMRHLGKKKIDYYTARKAYRFDVLYLPDIDSDAIYKMYKDKLDANKTYVLRTVYSEAFNFNSDYYDNFIAVFIVIITILDVISRVQEFIARKEIFDIRSVQYIFKSNGIPFYPEIPLRYQISMVKNLHTLLKYKSTKKCMVDICKLFGFENIKIFKYYLLRDRLVDLRTGDYIYSYDENGNEILEDEYELKFLKVPLEDDVDKYIRVGTNYLDYDEVTELDSTWDGGLEHEDVIKQILAEKFNFTRTKYISIDTIYNIAKMSMQQTYFFNFLYDNIELEENLKVTVPFISATKQYKIADLFTFLTALTYYYNDMKDTIMDTQSKVLYVNGFNFKADLAALATIIAGKNTASTIITDEARKDAQDILDRFIVYDTNIPSMSEMMDMYVNNLEVLQDIIDGMANADNKQTYDLYKMLYDSLMTIELTHEYYKNPETGDYYRDSEGDATFTEFLKHKEPDLYSLLLTCMDFDDVASRNQYIANVIDSITWALEEYISQSEFEGIYSGLPAVSAEVVKTYISEVINFYKSYKIDFLGMNTIYNFDDKNNGMITIIDCMHFNRFFQKHEYVQIYEQIAQSMVNMSFQEKVGLIDKVFLNIDTWSVLHPEVHLTFNEIIQMFYYFYKDDSIDIDDKFNEIITKKTIHENLYPVSDSVGFINIFRDPGSGWKDQLGVYDRCWIIRDGENISAMKKVDAEDENAVLLADAFGQAYAGPKIKDFVDPSNPSDGYIVTESGITSYMSNMDALHKSGDIINTINEDNPSDINPISEKAAVDALDIEVL